MQPEAGKLAGCRLAARIVSRQLAAVQPGKLRAASGGIRVRKIEVPATSWRA